MPCVPPTPPRTAPSRAPFLAAGLLGLLLAACATPRQTPPPPGASPRPSGQPTPSAVKLGAPYEVFGRLYVPEDDRTYDRRGIASWYGPAFDGARTANGETYNQLDLTAAHPTLPMPSWVEVTNLDNGRRIVVRVNDRGPFVEGRIIDLSRRAAELLGVDRTGLAEVRVRRVFPEGDWARHTPPLVQPGGPPRTRVTLADAVPYTRAQLAARTDSAASDRAARPAAREETAGRHWVQVAALADRGRAETLARRLAGFGPAATVAAPEGLWRVRLGPFATATAAAAALARLRAGGWDDARLVLAD